MSADPEAPAIEPDTPTPDAVSDPTPEIDYQKRYDDLRPEFDRTKQQLRDAESVWQDDERLLAALRQHRPDWLADNDEPDEPQTPEPAPTGTDPRVDELASKLEAIEAKERADQFEADFNAATGDREVPKQGREWIEYQVFTNGNDKQALDDAVKAWFEFEDSLKPKAERPRAPHVPAGGPPSEPPPPSNHQDRVQRALERIQAESA